MSTRTLEELDNYNKQIDEFYKIHIPADVAEELKSREAKKIEIAVRKKIASKPTFLKEFLKTYFFYISLALVIPPVAIGAIYGLGFALVNFIQLFHAEEGLNNGGVIFFIGMLGVLGLGILI